MLRKFWELELAYMYRSHSITASYLGGGGGDVCLLPSYAPKSGSQSQITLIFFYNRGAFTPWWHVQFCWLPIVNSRTLPYLRPVLDSSQWDGSSGVVYQCNWKKLRAISVTYFPNQSILCYILLCPPTPVMFCFWYTTDMDCPHQALSVSDKNNKFDQLLAWAMPFLKGT